MAERINFKHIREHADLAAVCAHYGIELVKDGQRPGQYKARCPFHDDQKPSLKLNLDKRIWHCFPCDLGGNVLDLVNRLEGNEDTAGMRDAARKVAELSGIPLAPGRARSPHGSSSATPSRQTGVVPVSAPESGAVTPSAAHASAEPSDPTLPPQNRVLTFTLQLSHPPELMTWLAARGISPEAVERFGLGLASAKSKTIGNRLAIPIQNAAGELVAYCGRHVGDDVPADVPKYVLPKGFQKEREVFNLHRVDPANSPTRGVLLVESFLSVIRHFPHLPVVSVMGRSIAPSQIELLRQKGVRRLVIVGDGDQPGRDGARKIAGDAAHAFWTRVVELEDGVKPHHLESATFEQLVTRALR